LKIFLSFLQSEHKYPIPAYDFWGHYIKNGIQEAGYQWTEFPGADWALGLLPQSKNDHLKWKQDIWGKTVEWLKKHPADIFLSYLYPEQIDASAIKEIQRTGIPCVNFFCDHIRLFKKAPAEFEVFNLNWVPEYQAAEWYKKAGYPCINLPMPMWVEPRYRVLKEETNQQITFIGSKDIQRKLLFEEVLEQDPYMPLSIYGNGWKNDDSPPQHLSDYTFDKKIIFNVNFIRQQGIIPYLRKIKHRNINMGLSSPLSQKTNKPPTFEQYNTLTAESMITLGVNRYPSFQFPLSKPHSYSRLRDIEAPMLGACYLTEYTDGIEELYDIENEIAVYKNADELMGKIKELQADFNRRKKLKINGQKRALLDHNIPNSLNKILQRV
jgi:hypothetical protein